MASDDYKDAIKKVMKAQRRPLTTRQISVKTDISWPTVKKHLEDLKKIGEAEKDLKREISLWSLKDKKTGKERPITREEAGRKLKEAKEKKLKEIEMWKKKNRE